MDIRLICFCMLLLAAFSVDAATVKPTNVRTTYKGPDGVTRYAEVITKHTSQTYGLKYQLSRVGLSVGSLGKMAKTAMGGPVAASITAAMLLKNWLWDGNDFIEPGEPASDYYECPDTVLCDEKFYSDRLNLDGNIYPNYQSALADTIADIESSGTFFHSIEVLNPDTIRVYIDTNGDGVINTSTHVRRYLGQDPVNTSEPEIGERTVTDDEIGQQILDSSDAGTSPPDLPTIIGRDSVTNGSWPNDWSELDTELSDLEGKLDDADNQNNNFTDQEERQFIDTDDKPQSDTDLKPQSEEQLTGCDLLPVVCDIYDWLTETATEPPVDEPEMTTEEYTIADLPNVTNQLGGGTCPSPETFSAFGETYDWSYQPLCDFATNINPFLIAFSWISAMLIVAGVKS